jgi:hypothetical protein
VAMRCLGMGLGIPWSSTPYSHEIHDLINN